MKIQTTLVSYPRAWKQIFTLLVVSILCTWQANKSFVSPIGSILSAPKTKEDPVSHCQNLVDGLIGVLQESINDRGLRNVTVGEDYVPGLDTSLLRSAFENQTMIVLGDSTLFYLMKWLYTLMHYIEKSPFTADMDLDTANHIINPDMDNHLHFGTSSKTPPPPYRTTNTHLRWFGFAGKTTELACDYPSYFELERISKVLKPDILVVNFGLHWFNKDFICIAHRWTYYEDDFLETILATAQKAQVKFLIFKTTNFVCSKHSPYLSNGTISTCVSGLQNLQESSSYNLTIEQLETYCRHTAWGDTGAAHLNHRLKTFVRSKQETLQLGDGVQLLLFNDHDVESCEYTNDGAHYHPLNLLRIRMLANLITCLRKI